MTEQQHDGGWRRYEETARHLLNRYAEHFGLQSVEGKQPLEGQSGTVWEVDAKGVCSEGERYILIESRRHTTSRLTQEHLAAIAWRIQDTGASGGITVTPLGLQKGAEFVAAAANIQDVRLSPDSTTDEYLLTSNRFSVMGLRDTIDLSKMSDYLKIFTIDEDGVHHPYPLHFPTPSDKKL